MVNIAICDDNPIYLRGALMIVDNYLNQFDNNIETRIFQFSSEKELSKWMQSFGDVLHILIVDICLDNNSNGIETAVEINKKFPNIKIIFMTAYLEQSADICNADFTYFVYKKSNWIKKLQNGLSKALLQIKEDDEKIILINGDIIAFKNIKYFQAEKKRCVIHLCNAPFVCVNRGINSIMPDLPTNFYQIHRSNIVNMDKISSINKTEKTIILNDETVLKVSRAKFKEFIENYYSYLTEKAIKTIDD